MDEYISVIKMFGCSFAPRSWALCNGALMSIAQNNALFALVGTTFGGNGTSTFGLPNLQGRTAIGMGTGPGLTPRVIGEASGTENVTILSSQMPQHNHFIGANTGAGTTGVPTNNYLSASPKNGSGPSAVSLNTFTTNAPDVILAAQTVSLTGGNQPITIMQPYLAVNYSICLYGIFPSRN